MPSPSFAQSDRAYWLTVLERIARPVLEAGAAGELRARMPIEHRPESTNRHRFAHLEVVGRTLCGIAPWLELEGLTGAEATLRAELADLARRTVASGVDPDSADFFNFTYDYQPIVDAAFLAQSFLRAPTVLWQPLSETTKAQVQDGLRATRTRKPGFSNWLLFGAEIEAFLYTVGAPDWDPMRVDYALRQHDQVIFGADRVAANGDVANKIGTYKLAVVAKENGIPVYCVAPTSTVDLSLAHGDLIPIEERGAEEVAEIGLRPIAPEGVAVHNPAFDITPHRYLTGIVTEEGICYPPFTQSLAAAVGRAEERVRENRKARGK